jgi:two-component system CheB/CheR fusion protein
MTTAWPCHFFHLSPDYPGQFDWIIQEVTKMPVRQVTATVAIEKNTANVISPGTIC